MKNIFINNWSTDININDSKYNISVNFALHKFEQIYVGIKLKFNDINIKKTEFIPNSILYSHRKLYIPYKIENKDIIKLVSTEDDDCYYILDYRDIENYNKIDIYLYKSRVNDSDYLLKKSVLINKSSIMEH